MPHKIIAANWKMHNDEYLSKKLTYDILKLLSGNKDTGVKKILCVPFPFIGLVSNMCEGNNSIYIGAQNCSSKEEGAYTGEVSAKMLGSLSVDYVIVGHSERRDMFNESNNDILSKVKRALSNNIIPIFCCGEPLSVREQNNHINYINNQLDDSILKLKKEEFKNLVIAYEPIWAIGSGNSASIKDIEEVHGSIRSKIKSKFGSTLAQSVSILYGGSVKPINAKEIFDLKDVDGGLIGGASLDPKSFVDIINSVN
tara:strand:- start:997 stop:1761 length:765 start_codon:yes stop_codon:yes gene_type:complete